MSGAIWVVVPAAGRGARFGAPLPKQYLQAGGQILLAHTWTRCWRTRPWPAQWW